MSSPPEPPVTADRSGTPAEETILEWRVHLAAREPGRAALVWLIVAAAGCWAVFLFQHLVPGLITVLLLTGAAGEYLLPVTYRLTTVAAEARNPLMWRRMAWSDVRRIYATGDTVKLSPLKYGGRREAFRGVLLRCADNQPAVLEAIRGRCPDLPLPEA
jgi:hypothetical protein